MPLFLPDATRGVVRSLDSTDLLNCGVQALQSNVFHLMQKPGSSAIKAVGGLHRLLGWTLPIVTDSGGFQIYSLIRQNRKYGQITDRGMVFRRDGSQRRFQLTPEKSVQLQMAYRADIVICLDDCTHVDEPLAAQEEAVRRTLQWARRCRSEFDRQWEQQCDKQAAERPRSAAEGVARPLLFAVVQGGGSRDLRKRCADGLLEMGFDGYGLGGWPLDSQGHLLLDIIAYIRELIPGTFPLHALGVGQPANVVACAQLGFGLFDSTMPTRDARHGRLYRFSSAPSRSTLSGDWFSYVYISDAQHIRADAPISPYCDCLCCSRYSLAYLHHLFRIKDTLFYRLATIHNLRFMVQLMDQLRLRLPGTGNGPGKPKTGHSEHG